MRSGFLWDFTQRSVVVSYKHLGSKYRSHLEWSRQPVQEKKIFMDNLVAEDGTDR